MFRLGKPPRLPYCGVVARSPKLLTREQVEGRKAKAVRFVRDVLGDPERADEIEAEDLQHYATRRNLLLTNPRRTNMPRKRTLDDYRDEIADLKDQISDLEDQNESLQDQLDDIADIVSPPDEEEEEVEEVTEDNGDSDDYDSGN